MILEIPDELIANQIAKEIVSIATKEIEKRMSLITKSVELPLYASQNELMKVLKVSSATIKYWIDCGLVYQDWSKFDSEKTQYKFERERVQEFLRTLEVTV